MFRKSPDAIAVCKEPISVSKVVKFAASHDIPISIRSVGHNVSDNSPCDDRFTID